jgi:hypothetical protein
MYGFTAFFFPRGLTFTANAGVDLTCARGVSITSGCGIGGACFSSNEVERTSIGRIETDIPLEEKDTTGNGVGS